MLTPTDDYAALARDFSWQVPKHYNIGVDVCDKWADGSGRLALIYEQADGHQTRYTFDDIRALSNRLANSLAKHGVVVGDRVGILLPQAPETAVSHVAAYKLGAIAVPLFTLFGVDALEYRLGNCAATALVTDREGLAKIRPIRHLLPALKTVYCVDGIASVDTAQMGDTGSAGAHAVLDFHAELAASSPAFVPRNTLADDPAVIIYTSGTTGKPKGALHAHRVLLGHLPGVEMSHNFFPEGASMMWTPADWAWIGGLLDVLMPSWHHGVPVLARRFEKFEASAAIELMARHKVTHTFLPPTALKLMRGKVDASVRPTLSLRSVASGGESLGEELIDWGRRVFGVTINEFYGQTECNMTVSSCSAMFAPQVGAIGKAVPGHAVAIVDEAGVPVAAGIEGNIGVRAPDPVMFLGYWNNPEATREKFAGEYLLTGDMGTCDEDGFIRFVGRNDDVITSAGYRIGPGPIEDCLMGHPAVRMAVVVGMPDAIRTEIVKAFIILHDGVTGNDALVKEIQAHVRTRLAAHEYPREIAFVDVLPMTATGKIIRRELRQLG
jgi:acetyl-CoA synthetase